MNVCDWRFGDTEACRRRMRWSLTRSEAFLSDTKRARFGVLRSQPKTEVNMDGSIPAEADLRPSSYAAGMMQPVRTLRCVIVDDNRAFLTIAALVLERDGVAVVATTTSSAEALECRERLHPDVVLLDIELGGESGFDLAVAIHRHPWVAVPAPPVILISAHDERDFADQVAASPASGFLPKWKLSAAAIRKSLAGVAEGEHETNLAA
jgi:CheY-like chemotaxis protein